MVVKCEHCGCELELADDSFGMTIDCENCHTHFVYDQFVLFRIIKSLRSELATRKKLSSQASRGNIRFFRRTAAAPQQQVVVTQIVKGERKNSHWGLCFFLGLLFGPLGWIFSIFIGGAEGFVAAILGSIFFAIMWGAIFGFVIKCGL